MEERSIGISLYPSVYVRLPALLVTMMLSAILMLFVYSLSLNSVMNSGSPERLRRPWTPPVVTDLGPLIDRENLS